MESVQLKFTDGALEAIAREALERKTGARGLRAILESIDARRDVRHPVAAERSKRCVISEEVVDASSEQPIVAVRRSDSRTG